MEKLFYGINLNTPDDKQFLTGHNLITVSELILAPNFYSAHSNDTYTRHLRDNNNKKQLLNVKYKSDLRYYDSVTDPIKLFLC